MQRFRTTAHAREQQQQQQQQPHSGWPAAAAAVAPAEAAPPRPALSYSAALFKSLDTHAAATANPVPATHAIPPPIVSAPGLPSSGPPLPPARDRTPSKGSVVAACVTPPSPAVEFSSCSMLHASDSVGEGCFDSHVSHSDSPSHGGSKSSSARSTPRASVSLQSHSDISYSASSLSPATAAAIAREAKGTADVDASNDDSSRKGQTSSGSTRASKDKADSKAMANKDHVAPPITDAQVFPTLGGVVPVVAAPTIKGAWGKAPPVLRAASISGVPSSSSSSSASSAPSSSSRTPSTRTPLCGGTPGQKSMAPSAANQAALHEEAMMLSANAVPAAASASASGEGCATPKQEDVKLEAHASKDVAAASASTTLAITVPKDAHEEKQLSPNVLRPAQPAAGSTLVVKPKKGAPVLCLQLPASSTNVGMSPPTSSDGSLTSSGHSANSAREGSSKPLKNRREKARRSKMVEALAALSMDGLRSGSKVDTDEPGSGAASAGSSSSRTRSPAGVKSLSLASSSESNTTVPNTPHSLVCTSGATTPSTPTLMSAHQHQQNQQQQASRSKLEQTRQKLQQRRAQTLRPSPSSRSIPSGPSVSIPGSGTSSPIISHRPLPPSSAGGLPKSASARNFSHMSNSTYRNERSGGALLSQNSPRHSAQSTPTHSQYYAQGYPAQPHFFQAPPPVQPQLIGLLPHAPTSVNPAAAAAAYAMQAQHAVAAAAVASGYRGHTPVGVHSQPASTAPSPRVTPATPRLETIKLQLEYYFSDDNLARDLYLRSLMNRRGYVPIGKLLEFNRLRAITTKALDVLTAAKASQYLKLKNGAIRSRGESWRKFVPPTPAATTNTTDAAQADADLTDEENEETRLANLVHTPSAPNAASAAAAASAVSASGMPPTDSPTPSMFSSSSEGSNESAAQIAALGQPLVAPMPPLIYAAPPMPLPVLPSYASPYVYPLSYFPAAAAASGGSPYAGPSYAYIPVYSSAPVPTTPPLYTISLPTGPNHAGVLPYPTPLQIPVMSLQQSQQQSPQMHARDSHRQQRKKHEGSKPATPAGPCDAATPVAPAAIEAASQPVRKHSLNHYASAPAAFATTAEAKQASDDAEAAAAAESKQPEQNGH